MDDLVDGYTNSLMHQLQEQIKDFTRGYTNSKMHACDYRGNA